MKRLVIAALALFGLVVAVAPVTAQQYPSRTVTIIVPYPAGGRSTSLRAKLQLHCQQS
jgi:tripartite-type tricarboxylate transporter receptor subunit TctC